MRPLLLLAPLFVALGCGGNKPAPATDPAQGNAAAREPWFCQAGSTDEEWECVQSEALAANPEPKRLPAGRRPAAEEPEPAPRPPASPSSELAPPNFTPPNGAPPKNVPPPAPRPTPTAPPPPSRPAPDQVPKYVALSYRPDKPVAILDLPADFYAVQLVAVSSKETLEAFAQKNKIRGMSAARVWNGEKLFYVLLLGIYETRANAQAAIDSLAPPFDTMNPWIRSLGSLQQSMLAADDAAGTTEI